MAKSRSLYCILISLILVSCGLGNGNFTKQKYTNLRPIKNSVITIETSQESLIPVKQFLEPDETSLNNFLKDTLANIEKTQSEPILHSESPNNKKHGRNLPRKIFRPNRYLKADSISVSNTSIPTKAILATRPSSYHKKQTKSSEKTWKMILAIVLLLIALAVIGACIMAILFEAGAIAIWGLIGGMLLFLIAISMLMSSISMETLYHEEE